MESEKIVKKLVESVPGFDVHQVPAVGDGDHMGLGKKIVDRGLILLLDVVGFGPPDEQGIDIGDRAGNLGTDVMPGGENGGEIGAPAINAVVVADQIAE